MIAGASTSSVRTLEKNRVRQTSQYGSPCSAVTAAASRNDERNGAPIPAAKYFVPGSVLSVKVDTTHPLAAGMGDRANVFFDNSPVFKLGAGAEAAGVRAFAHFDSATPLRSGWAWGQQYLNGGVAAVEARVGKGRVVLYGPEILQRAQPHGTFKLLFNALLVSSQ